MSYKIERLSEPFKGCKAPHWDVKSQTLFFSHLQGAQVVAYKPATNEIHTAVIGDGKCLKMMTPFLVPVEGQPGKFLIADKNELATITWDGKSPNTSKPVPYVAVVPQDKPYRLNDTKADARGRIWTATIQALSEDPEGLTLEPVGSLFSVSDGGKTIKKHLSGIRLSNGLTWSPDNKKFYYVDSFKYRIDSYDYDIETGTLSNEKTLIDFKEANIPGEPDGMTVDTEGKLHIVMWNSGLVLRIDPDNGKILWKIKIPALLAVSCAWGGKNMDELYVTTANIDSKALNCKKSDDGYAGCLYRITNLGVKGVTVHNVKL